MWRIFGRSWTPFNEPSSRRALVISMCFLFSAARMMHSLLIIKIGPKLPYSGWTWSGKWTALRGFPPIVRRFTTNPCVCRAGGGRRRICKRGLLCMCKPSAPASVSFTNTPHPRANCEDVNTRYFETRATLYLLWKQPRLQGPIALSSARER